MNMRGLKQEGKPDVDFAVADRGFADIENVLKEGYPQRRRSDNPCRYRKYRGKDAVPLFYQGNAADRFA